MCYNCGCAMPDDDHGDARNITNATFEAAAEAVDQRPEQARTNTDQLLHEVDHASGQKTS